MHVYDVDEDDEDGVVSMIGFHPSASRKRNSKRKMASSYLFLARKSQLQLKCSSGASEEPLQGVFQLQPVRVVQLRQTVRRSSELPSLDCGELNRYNCLLNYRIGLLRDESAGKKKSFGFGFDERRAKRANRLERRDWTGIIITCFLLFS